MSPYWNNQRWNAKLAVVSARLTANAGSHSGRTSTSTTSSPPIARAERVRLSDGLAWQKLVRPTAFDERLQDARVEGCFWVRAFQLAQNNCVMACLRSKWTERLVQRPHLAPD